ncbi:MAG: hypothetical protein GY868_18090 [Deltaproteobacteria bacterium]|nr:hypothetical protein [Deltaproteobacteria bacterium]
MMKRMAMIIMVLALGSRAVSADDTVSSTDNQTSTAYVLPLPGQVDMILEEAISKRKSHRIFTEETVTDEELSTVLWAAYGMRDDGKRTVAAIDDVHAAVMYILKEDAVYKYNPHQHALELYKQGDYRVAFKDSAVIYMAPVQIVLCWDTARSDLLRTSVEIGAVGQTILLASVSLGLGTVVTAQSPFSMEHIGLPEQEAALVMMPLGHLKNSYKFSEQPNRISMLEMVTYSDMSFSTALQERNATDSPGGSLSAQEKSQLIWAAYGFSPLRDKQLNFIYLPRHRTVPSPHYTYDAVIMYVVMDDGIYKYCAFSNLKIPGQPVVDYLVKVVEGDKREALAQACSRPALAAAPLSIISIMDVANIQSSMDNVEKSTPIEQYWPYWYFVAGASAHNMLLEATALQLAGMMTYPDDPAALLSVLGLNDETLQPLLVVSVGSHAGSM